MPSGTPGADQMNEADVRVSHECWVTVEKIMSCDLSIRCILPLNRKSVIIAVGAAYDILIDEAHNTGLSMRMQETKGAMEFHTDLIRYYSSNHGGLNEYEDGKWKPRDPSLMKEIELEVGENRKESAGIIRHWAPEEQLPDTYIAEQKERDLRICPRPPGAVKRP
jgi:hypothetical protein